MKMQIVMLCAMALLLSWRSPIVAADNSDLMTCREQPGTHKMHCIERRLEDIIKTKGTEAALTALESLTQADPVALQESHPLVHHIGKASFAHYGTAPLALSHCTAQFWSGCYHGVLQAYLSSLPVVEPTHIPTLCPISESVPAYSFQRYNCVHGVGHGLTMAFRYDLPKSLTFCDAFDGHWERESCYGGVFMENIVAFQETRRPQPAHHHEGRTPTSFPTARDPLYPCSVLQETYLPACYLMQTSAMLTLSGYDFAQVFSQCARVPEPHAVTCARSLGRDISGYTLRRIDRVRELCALGHDAQVGECLIGAVKDFMLTDASPDPGLALCRAVDPRYKHGCYDSVGEIALSLFPDRTQREAACRRGEDTYVDACLTRVRAQ